MQGLQLDPETKRMQKIERFKADKALAAQLASMKAQRSSAAAAAEVRHRGVLLCEEN